MTTTPFLNPTIKDKFETYPAPIRNKLLALRELIFGVAAEMEAVDQLEETLKWNQPSYLTTGNHTGTTIRIDQAGDRPYQYALYVHCQTTLIETFRLIYPAFNYEGTRAIVFDIEDDVPMDILKDFIGMALTYHLQKKQPFSSN